MFHAAWTARYNQGRDAYSAAAAEQVPQLQDASSDGLVPTLAENGYFLVRACDQLLMPEGKQARSNHKQ